MRRIILSLVAGTFFGVSSLTLAAEPGFKLARLWVVTNPGVDEIHAPVGSHVRLTISTPEVAGEPKADPKAKVDFVGDESFVIVARGVKQVGRQDNGKTLFKNEYTLVVELTGNKPTVTDTVKVSAKDENGTTEITQFIMSHGMR